MGSPSNASTDSQLKELVTLPETNKVEELITL